MKRITLSAPEKDAVEFVDGHHIKPRPDVACHLVTSRTIATTHLDTGRRLFWHADEGHVFNSLLPHADELED